VATVKKTTQDRVSDHFDEAIRTAIAGEHRYPNGATFLGVEDSPGLGQEIVEAAREGRPIVLVYPDGETRFLLPEHPYVVSETPPEIPEH
jgi:hypothetical protein